MILIKTGDELRRMRDAGRIVAEILALLSEKIAPGVTTLELDRLAERECRKRGAKPAFKGYGGFPFSICASPEDRVVHGFASDRPLVEGEILSIDFGVVWKGFHGDSAVTLPVGAIGAEKQKLLDVTRRSLEMGIAQAKVGNRLFDISHAVQSYVEKHGFSVVKEFVGHGIGRGLHEDPQVPNFGPPGQGPLLRSGMVLAIEPMVNAGKGGVKVLEDGWTAVTLDGKPSAHFEHTVAITEEGPQILTAV
ncbi:methionine aminopeptidase, type I [Syntrophotalea carbinolica DSM 2380]|uniref:Methionine aminopeptidase n=1 Tax=Syntrophotalea carbinolica (strain DSM 2380 / NBRC 103641 / GraBd1) TaxID=338963 RepID=Q3A6M5_SYNC1|nr:type I methionyl aminopeptidase [Syntrophotalea carbinolica]ABA87982.1 methionine aminopeptidase, type I [Syntrophotalea carbinolica DSM 2380]